jgi:hypothetical protein
MSVYNFMKGPHVKIPSWIQTQLPPKPSSTGTDNPEWNIEDIPDPIIMSAAAKVSLKLQDLQEHLPVTAQASVHG